MDYQNKKFSVSVGGDAYRDGWDRIFGKDAVADAPSEPAPESRRCRAFVTADVVRRVGQCVLPEGHKGGHFPEKPPEKQPEGREGNVQVQDSSVTE